MTTLVVTPAAGDSLECASNGGTGRGANQTMVERSSKQPRDVWPGRVRVSGSRVAVVSDTHEQDDGWGSPPQLLEALRGVDLILHCGDLDVLGVLDHLETIAPVLAVRGYPDPREAGTRLADDRTRVVDVAGVRIGMMHDIRGHGPARTFTHTIGFPRGDIDDQLARQFGETVDIVCFGDTHEEYIGWYQGVLFVNPGSTTIPGLRHGPGELGTFALLDIDDGVVSARIEKLRREG